MGDGQATQGDFIVKPNVTKVRRVGESAVGGFAGGNARRPRPPPAPGARARAVPPCTLRPAAACSRPQQPGTQALHAQAVRQI